MNVQTKPPMTVAEKALTDDTSVAPADLPGDDTVQAQRRRLLDGIAATGLPTRRAEAWHYTDLRTLLKSVPKPGKRAEHAAVEPFVPGSTVLAVNDGHASEAGVMPAGVTAAPYRTLLSNGKAAAAMEDGGRDDVVGRINGAFATDGFSLTLAGNTALGAPVEVQVLHGGGQAHTRFPVTIGSGASGTIFERHRAVGGDDALVSSITDLDVGAGAEIAWIIVQEQGAADSHFSRINVHLGANAKLMLYIVNAGGHLVRQEIDARVAGEGADMKLRGINLLGGDSHTDVTMTLDHDQPSTTSTEILRNVVFDRARGVFQGKISVAPEAQKTDAKMACNTLLLSDDGDFSSKPELEIFADDVQCGHGATVADIDDNHLFYLMSRGVPEKRARAMLVRAFVAEIVEELDDEATVEALETVIADWLETHT